MLPFALGMRFLRPVALIVASLALASPLLAAAPAAAAVASFAFTVTTPLDGLDDNPGDGACFALSQDGCTLRAALEEAVAHPGTSSVITVPAGRYVFTLGPLEACCNDSNITVAGAGAGDTIIDGEGLAAAYTIDSGTIALDGMTITGVNVDAQGRSGAITSSSPATVTLNDSVLSDNVRGVYATGSVAYATGSVVLNRTTITRSSEEGIRSTSSVTLNQSTVSNGTQIGIVLDVTCDSFPYCVAGRLALVNSTVSGNAGGILDASTQAPYKGGILTVAGSTVANNSTIAFNGANISGAGFATLQNSIVANPTEGPNCDTPANDAGFNLDSGGSCGFGATSYSNVDPLLAPLAVGAPGAAATHALAPGSPAINAGGSAAAGCQPTDERGVARPQAGACDIGAYEVVNPGVLGGKGFRLQGTGGSATLSWQGGDAQTGYLVLRAGSDGSLTTVPAAGPLPASATGVTDTPPPTAQAYCYALLSLRATSILRLSDALCFYPNTASATFAPSNFTAWLNQPPLVGLTWTKITSLPESERDALLTVRDVPGTQPIAQFVPPNVVDSTDGVPTCYLLIDQLDLQTGQFVGNSDALCALPGIALPPDRPAAPGSTPSRAAQPAAPTSVTAAAARLQQAVARLHVERTRAALLRAASGQPVTPVRAR